MIAVQLNPARPEEDWQHIEDDRTCGIYGGWVHWCPGAEVPANIEPDVEVERYVGAGADRQAVLTYSADCPRCEAHTTWQEMEWEPEYDDDGPFTIQEVR